jgi:hypothetical protein
MKYSESRNTANPKIKSISGDIINISNIDISLLNINKKCESIRGINIFFCIYIIILSLLLYPLKRILITFKKIDCKNRIVTIDSFTTYYKYFISKHSYNSKKRKDYITPLSGNFYNIERRII